MDQDLPNETSADSRDTFYATWINVINMYIRQPINTSGTKRHAVFFQWIKAMSKARDSLNADVHTTTNQVYEPEDFILLGLKLDHEIN